MEKEPVILPLNLFDAEARSLRGKQFVDPLMR
jgi:hypothetical protein